VTEQTRFGDRPSPFAAGGAQRRAGRTTPQSAALVAFSSEIGNHHALRPDVLSPASAFSACACADHAASISPWLGFDRRAPGAPARATEAELPPEEAEASRSAIEAFKRPAIDAHASSLCDGADAASWRETIALPRARLSSRDRRLLLAGE